MKIPEAAAAPLEPSPEPLDLAGEMPAFSSADIASLDTAAPAPLSTLPPRRKRRSTATRLWLLIGGAAAALLAVVVGVVFLLASSNEGKLVADKNEDSTANRSDGVGIQASENGSAVSPPATGRVSPTAEVRRVEFPLVKRTVGEATASRPRVVCARPPSPFLLIDERVIDAQTGRQVGSVPPSPQWGGAGLPTQALHADGRYFAYRSRSGLTPCVVVVDCAKGQESNQFIPRTEAPISNVVHVDFLPNDSLVVTATTVRGEYVTGVWDIPSNRTISTFQWHGVARPTFALHPDGSQLAAAVGQQIELRDVMTGHIIDTLDIPPEAHQGRDIVESLQALAFSCEGDQIGGLFVSMVPANVATPDAPTSNALQVSRRLVVWPRDGRAVTLAPSVEYGGSSTFGGVGDSLCHAPDGLGWIVGGVLIIDAESKLPLWKVAVPSSSYNPCGVTGQGEVLFSVGVGRSRTPGQVVAVKWPADRLRELAKTHRPDANLLKSGQPISLEVEVGTILTGSEQEAADRIRESASSLLADRRGLQLVDGADLVCSIRYAETMGETRIVGGKPAVVITEAQIRGDLALPAMDEASIRAQKNAVAKYKSLGLLEDAGPNRSDWKSYRIKNVPYVVSEAVPGVEHSYIDGKFIIELKRRDESASLWTGAFVASHVRRRGTNDVDQESLRKGLLREIANRFTTDPMPVFLADAGRVDLPILQPLR